MTRDRVDLQSAHEFSSKNRELLNRSEVAGCFYCMSRFDPNQIMDWIDGDKFAETGDLDDGVTALCPKCGTDSVLPSAAPIQLDDKLLEEMKKYWF